MRVVFLDFGGVTHPSGSEDDTGNTTFAAARLVGRLDVFCWIDILIGLLAEHADVFVVVHSNWRYARSPQEIGDLLGDLGNRYLGCTPAGDRHASILAWLERNPGVQAYRILDDSARAFSDPPPPELILCDPRTGLSEPRVQAQLRDWLQSS